MINLLYMYRLLYISILICQGEIKPNLGEWNAVNYLMKGRTASECKDELCQRDLEQMRQAPCTIAWSAELKREDV